MTVTNHDAGRAPGVSEQASKPHGTADSIESGESIAKTSYSPACLCRAVGGCIVCRRWDRLIRRVAMRMGGHS